MRHQNTEVLKLIWVLGVFFHLLCIWYGTVCVAAPDPNQFLAGATTWKMLIGHAVPPAPINQLHYLAAVASNYSSVASAAFRFAKTATAILADQSACMGRVWIACRTINTLATYRLVKYKWFNTLFSCVENCLGVRHSAVWAGSGG
jgi:hypothetical protein